MVKKGIVIGHMVSEKGIEVDKAKVEEIEKMPPPTSMKGLCSFLGQVGFYRHFVKEFSKTVKLYLTYLQKMSLLTLTYIVLMLFVG